MKTRITKGYAWNSIQYLVEVRRWGVWNHVATFDDLTDAQVHECMLKTTVKKTPPPRRRWHV